MSDLFGGLVVILGTLVFIGIIFLLVQKRKKGTEDVFRALADQKGWVVEKVDEPNSSGFRIRNSRWTYEDLKLKSTVNRSTGSPELANISCWHSARVSFSPGILLIGPKQPTIDLGGLGAVIKQTMLKLMIGDEANDALGIEEALIGRMALRERYMVWTNSEEHARDILTDRVENALLRYPGKTPPVVKFSPTGLEVKVLSQSLKNPDEIAGLVAIGEAFLE
jgi:hypothetical protein